MAMTKKISFQGELGAYSHLACTNMFPDYEVVPCRDFRDTLACVSEGNADLAMIPVENTVAGRVADIHNLVGNSKLKIYAEHFENVKHQLIAKPGVEITALKTVRSHAMGLGQCTKVIDALNLQPIVMADTAGSAKYLSEQGEEQECAIASELAAKIYKLNIVQTNIEDDPNNTTRFLVMSKNLQQEKDSKQEYLTSCIIETKSIPSALYKALGGFATNGVNMIKLESFIIEGDFNKAQFYIELEGHLGEASVAGAMEELKSYTNKLTILGEYPKHQYRSKS
jgi:prephenate dehydratase|tara:strand:+ start:304 stop:1149 length:846 start_codon:yes stop_codon:yes gene_type:complete